MNNRNLIVALAVVALLAVAATTAGCATNTTPSPTPIPATTTSSGNNTTLSNAAGFNITFNKSLKIDSNTSASNLVRLYVYLNPNETADGVLVAAKGLAAGQTLNDFVNSEIKQLKDNASVGFYKSFNVTSETNSTFAGKPAHTIVWSAIVPVQYNKTTSTNTSVKEMHTYVVNNNMGYVITYKAVASDYDTYLAQAQRIMNSFVLT
jgi:Flp pilus assembly protein CpaB